MVFDSEDRVAGVNRGARTWTDSDSMWCPMPDSILLIRDLVRKSATRLVDGFGRVHSYIRIAVQEQCNLRCIYCMPEEGVDFTGKEDLLTSEEILRILRLMVGLGVDKVRFTGGEPLLRRDILELIEKSTGLEGVESVHLTTNGLLLAAMAADLRRAGLTGLNISLDTLNPVRFRQITRCNGLARVLKGLQTALDIGFPSVKVNVVALRGLNDDEFSDFVKLTREAPITVRFIELMPFDSHQVWKRGHFYSADWLVQALKKAFPDLQDASGTRTEKHIYKIPGHAGKVAVIPGYTRSTCTDCNRIRLTADGRIRNCLYSSRELDLKHLMRSGGTDEEVVDRFRMAIGAKLESGWDAQKRPEAFKDHDVHGMVSGDRDSMSLIGG